MTDKFDPACQGEDGGLTDKDLMAAALGFLFDSTRRPKDVTPEGAENASYSPASPYGQPIPIEPPKATEGPWSVEVDDDGECWIRIPGHDLNFGDMETTDACCFAVARLIAEAPNLLRELKFLLNEYTSEKNAEFSTVDNPDPAADDECVVRARAVIARAERSGVDQKYTGGLGSAA